MAFLPGLVKLVKKVAKPLGKIIESLPVVGAPFKTLQNVSQPFVVAGSKMLGAAKGTVKLVKKVPKPVIYAGGGAAAGVGVSEMMEGSPDLPGGGEGGGGGGGALVPYAGGGAAAGLMSMKGKGALLNTSIMQALSSIALPAQNVPLKLSPPRGYVIVRSINGWICIPKAIALHFGLWHRSRRPPISAGDWHKYQTARRVEKKLRSLAAHELRRHHSGGRHYEHKGKR